MPVIYQSLPFIIYIYSPSVLSPISLTFQFLHLCISSSTYFPHVSIISCYLSLLFFISLLVCIDFAPLLLFFMCIFSSFHSYSFCSSLLPLLCVAYLSLISSLHHKQDFFSISVSTRSCSPPSCLPCSLLTSVPLHFSLPHFLFTFVSLLLLAQFPSSLFHFIFNYISSLPTSHRFHTSPSLSITSS